MSEKPILFNTQMVQAIIQGQKTMTRRLIKGVSTEWHFEGLDTNPAIAIVDKYGELQPKEVNGLYATFNGEDTPCEYPMFKAPYEVGDILYVRETWAPMYPDHESTEIVGYLFRADRDIYGEEYQKAYDATYPNGKDWTWEGKWRPSLHMPKAAARLWLRVTEISVEHLQDMTIDDVLHEGVSIAQGFTDWIPLWNSTIPAGNAGKAYSWESNPWVWVIHFEKI